MREGATTEGSGRTGSQGGRSPDAVARVHRVWPRPHEADAFPLSCNGLSCDVLDSDNSVTLAPNEPDTVEVEFTTGSSPGAGSVMLTVGDGFNTGLINSASKSVTVIVAADVSVNTVPASVTQYSEANTATFDVKSTTGSSLQYTITCTWQGAQGCSPSPSSPTIGGGATTTVTATEGVARRRALAHRLRRRVRRW